VVVQPSEISIAHRLKAGPKDKNRPNLVRFTTCKARNEVFGAKRLFKSSAGGIFISEHLTKPPAELFYLARALLRERKIGLHATWSKNGQILTQMIYSSSCCCLCGHFIITKMISLPFVYRSL